MTYSAAEKLEVIELIEQSHWSAKRTLFPPRCHNAYMIDIEWCVIVSLLLSQAGVRLNKQQVFFVILDLRHLRTLVTRPASPLDPVRRVARPGAYPRDNQNQQP